MSLEAALAAGIEELGLAIGPSRRKLLLTYVSLLAKWNAVYNLSAIRTEREMLSHHVQDALAIVPHLPGGRLVDVGSGGGLPGIPVAIAEPDRSITLLDSSRKKAAFLQQAVIELGLKNASVHSARVERWHAERPFDVITSRAFADLAEFVSRTRHLLAQSGVFAAMKGAYPRVEIEHLPEGFRVRSVQRLAVPGVSAERHLVLVERASP